MATNKSCFILTFISGICLLQYVRGSTIDLVAYKGKVGHVTSYNYPFQHSYSEGSAYTYRLFADTSSPQKLCLTVHRFEMTLYDRLTIHVKLSDGTTQLNKYTQFGANLQLPANSPLPDNIWKQPFCVDLAGDGFLTVTFNSLLGTRLIPGFYLEYQATTPETNVNTSPPCAVFTCYNRECVSATTCTDQAACADKSDNTFAHGFCKNSDGSPIQQSGFWAHNLDVDMGIEKGLGWYFTERIEDPSRGPPSDHTGGGMFLYTKFLSTHYDVAITFNPGKLAQKESCLSFWYYMDGINQGELTAQWGANTVWTRSGSYGEKWLQAQANLFCESDSGCDGQVKITASRPTGSNPNTTISIDDISVMPGLCPFYEADLLNDAWTTDDGCTFLSGRLSCSSLSSSSGLTKSWLVSRGRCLVGDVLFDTNTNPGQTVMVFEYPQGDMTGNHLETIRQSTANEKVQFKIPLELSIPAKIGFKTIFNKGRISLENIHVVDNECDNMDTHPTKDSPGGNGTSTNSPPNCIIAGVIMAIGVFSAYNQQLPMFK